MRTCACLAFPVPGCGVVSGPPSCAALLSCERPARLWAPFPGRAPGRGACASVSTPAWLLPGPPAVSAQLAGRRATLLPSAFPFLSERCPGGRETSVLSPVTCALSATGWAEPRRWSPVTSVRWWELTFRKALLTLRSAAGSSRASSCAEIVKHDTTQGPFSGHCFCCGLAAASAPGPPALGSLCATRLLFLGQQFLFWTLFCADGLFVLPVSLASRLGCEVTGSEPVTHR